MRPAKAALNHFAVLPKLPTARHSSPETSKAPQDENQSDSTTLLKAEQVIEEMHMVVVPREDHASAE